jgi:hypothetical protein
MPQAFSEPAGNTTVAEVVEKATIEIQHERGILYVYAQDGKPLLKITGLPRPVPRLTNGDHIVRQLTIDIRHEATVCNWGPTPTVITPNNPVPHPIEDDPWREQRDDAAAYILNKEGATMLPRAKGERTS